MKPVENKLIDILLTGNLTTGAALIITLFAIGVLWRTLSKISETHRKDRDQWLKTTESIHVEHSAQLKSVTDTYSVAFAETTKSLLKIEAALDVLINK